MAEIVIPDPSLVVLVGAAGAGKSTFAASHFAPTEILSSDRFREIVSGDAADQAATRTAFARLHSELERRLGDRRLTVVDATSIERSARRSLVALAVAADVGAVAIVLDLPATVVLSRNATRRARTVDEAVVRRQLDRLRIAIDGPGAPIERDGFTDIVLLHDPADVDVVTIRRQPS